MPMHFPETLAYVSERILERACPMILEHVQRLCQRVANEIAGLGKPGNWRHIIKREAVMGRL